MVLISEGTSCCSAFLLPHTTTMVVGSTDTVRVRDVCHVREGNHGFDN